jgi:hypothetical protein
MIDSGGSWPRRTRREARLDMNEVMGKPDGRSPQESGNRRSNGPFPAAITLSLPRGKQCPDHQRVLPSFGVSEPTVFDAGRSLWLLFFSLILSLLLRVRLPTQRISYLTVGRARWGEGYLVQHQ